MKIYPNEHYVYFRKQISLSEIPLSYVYNEEKDRLIDIAVMPAFSKPYHETAAYPYQTFDTNQILFFDKNGKSVDNSPSYLQFDGTQYVFLPEAAQTFAPKQFQFDLLLQRDDRFRKDISYHLTFGIHGTEELQNRIVSAVQNRENQKEYPANIIINHGETTVEKFQNVAESDCDFLFFPFSTTDDNFKEKIEKRIDQHINVWLYDDSFAGQIGETDSPLFRLENAMLYTTDSGELPNYTDADGKYIQFTPNSTLPLWDDPEQSYTEVPFFLFGAPLRIFHKKDSGYLILSHSSFFSSLDTENPDQLRLFFETIMFIYLHGYYNVSMKNLFITDDVIHYYIDMAQQYSLSHPRINLDRLLTKQEENPLVQHNVIRCDITPADKTFTVDYVGMNRFNDLLFQKKSTVKDPSLGNNVLVYTIKNKILLCNPDFAGLRLIESGIQIREIDAYTIGISAAKSSMYRINTDQEQLVTLPVAANYTICYDTELAQFIAVMGSNAIAASYVPVAKVSITQNEDIEYKDIRKNGGGEASVTPNYEMIDTGNIYGRPYRYGCPMLIQIPSRFKSMQNEIESEVKKHAASGDYPIIIYKD